MTVPQRILDRTDPTRVQYELDMGVRNALLALLRAWEDRCGLPRSIPTNRERVEAGEEFEKGGHIVTAPARKGHHNR